MLKIIRITAPTHIAVLFDGEHENMRSGLITEYKANRPDYSETSEKETSFSQLHDIYAALDFLGIKHTESVDCETDDIIAAYALTYGRNNKIVISSFDSDFFQLNRKRFGTSIPQRKNRYLHSRLHTRQIRNFPRTICR